jgi:hypothetical protein
LKIDVEGFENDVLIGASDVLKNVRPDAIVLETNEQNQPSFRERRAVKTLRQFFYRFLSIPKAKLLMRAKPFDEDTIQDPGLDVIAVPEEKFVEIEKAVGRDLISKFKRIGIADDVQVKVNGRHLQLPSSATRLELDWICRSRRGPSTPINIGRPVGLESPTRRECSPRVEISHGSPEGGQVPPSLAILCSRQRHGREFVVTLLWIYCTLAAISPALAVGVLRECRGPQSAGRRSRLRRHRGAYGRGGACLKSSFGPVRVIRRPAFIKPSMAANAPCSSSIVEVEA